MLRACDLIPSHDVLFVTLDTLRHDVAVRAMRENLTPNLKSLIPTGEWEERHTPGNFTYAAHHAFFAGFLPTPTHPGRHVRLFASRFGGSETTGDGTFVFDAPDLVQGLGQHGYHTVCIGGVGFFNKQNSLGSVFPAMFDESYWETKLGVTEPRSTEYQVDLAVQIVGRIPQEQRVFLFINISALHQPNRMYLPGATEDSVESQLHALAYVDTQLPPLFSALQKRAPVFTIICSDHGTAYGEDGFVGHRVNHPVVWTVPYAEFVLLRQ